VLRISVALKNLSSPAESEPENLGSNGKHDNHYTTENDIHTLNTLNNTLPLNFSTLP
jgi:hypothetical protein